jgi:hypothetical protein
LKAKFWVDRTFSDFVEKPASFEVYPSLLFERSLRNLSFKVGGEVIYVLQGILTSRCQYFKTMLGGSFTESKVPMNAESMIPIEGIDVGVFKMIIEWIYTTEILQLNVSSPRVFYDLGVSTKLQISMVFLNSVILSRDT